MSSPVILQGGYVLPLPVVHPTASGYPRAKPPHRHPITGLTINFRDPEYSPKRAAGIRSKYASSLPEKTGGSITSPIFTFMQGIHGLSLKRCRCELDATIHVAFPLWRYLSCRRP